MLQYPMYQSHGSVSEFSLSCECCKQMLCFGIHNGVEIFLNKHSYIYQVWQTGFLACKNQFQNCDVIKFFGMRSLCLMTAPDCHTGQSSGRYCARSLIPSRCHCSWRCRILPQKLLSPIVVACDNSWALKDR